MFFGPKISSITSNQIPLIFITICYTTRPEFFCGNLFYCNFFISFTITYDKFTLCIQSHTIFKVRGIERYSKLDIM
eukprot:UN19603